MFKKKSSILQIGLQQQVFHRSLNESMEKIKYWLSYKDQSIFYDNDSRLRRHAERLV